VAADRAWVKGDAAQNSKQAGVRPGIHSKLVSNRSRRREGRVTSLRRVFVVSRRVVNIWKLKV
jgi:hypothetical protein